MSSNMCPIIRKPKSLSQTIEHSIHVPKKIVIFPRTVQAVQPKPGMGNVIRKPKPLPSPESSAEDEIVLYHTDSDNQNVIKNDHVITKDLVDVNIEIEPLPEIPVINGINLNQDSMWLHFKDGLTQF